MGGDAGDRFGAVGRQDQPQRIFELLGKKGEVPGERLALRDAFVEALDAYRREAWDKVRAGFEKLPS